jgi:hypothetical protein
MAGLSVVRDAAIRSIGVTSINRRKGFGRHPRRQPAASTAKTFDRDPSPSLNWFKDASRGAADDAPVCWTPHTAIPYPSRSTLP